MPYRDQYEVERVGPLVVVEVHLALSGEGAEHGHPHGHPPGHSRDFYPDVCSRLGPASEFGAGVLAGSGLVTHDWSVLG